MAGRGTRIVEDAAALDSAYERCQSEAKAAFGVADVYVEQFSSRARHVEVQILGDCEGHVAHLGERECSVQRRHQKVVEIAPAPELADDVRTAIIEAAVRFAKKERYENLGTFEFLVDASASGSAPFVFIETNARLQVEHTVTEAGDRRRHRAVAAASCRRGQRSPNSAWTPPPSPHRVATPSKRA